VGLEFGEDLQRAVGPPRDVPAELAGEHAPRGGERAFGAGVDQVRDGLGLRQVEAAGEVRAARELAGLGQAAAAREAVLGDPAHEQRVAVAGDLERVVPGERTAGRPEHDDDLVDRRAGLVAPDAERRRLLGGGRLPGERRRRDRSGERSVDADDRQGRAARRSRGGDDGLGGGHGTA